VTWHAFAGAGRRGRAPAGGGAGGGARGGIHPMFGTTLLNEYRVARDHLGLDDPALRALAAASITSSFAPGWLKREALG
jgi:Adenosine deaminase